VKDYAAPPGTPTRPSQGPASAAISATARRMPSEFLMLSMDPEKKQLYMCSASETNCPSHSFRKATSGSTVKRRAGSKPQGESPIGESSSG